MKPSKWQQGSDNIDHLSNTHWMVSPTSWAKCNELDCGRITSISTIKSSLRIRNIQIFVMFAKGKDLPHMVALYIPYLQYRIEPCYEVQDAADLVTWSGFTGDYTKMSDHWSFCLWPRIKGKVATNDSQNSLLVSLSIQRWCTDLKPFLQSGPVIASWVENRQTSKMSISESSGTIYRKRKWHCIEEYVVLCILRQSLHPWRWHSRTP